MNRPRENGRRRRSPRIAAALLGCGLPVACGSGPDPVAIVDSPPQAAEVRDGVGADLDSQELTTALFANWDAFVDPEGMPVVYEWSIGRAPTHADVLNWTRVGGARKAAAGDIGLPRDVRLFVNVRAVDFAGNRSAIASSDGIVLGRAPDPPAVTQRVDPPPPRAGQVRAVTRHGITWTFRRAAPGGRFANGDWWVVGPVDVVAIEPSSRSGGGRVQNGAMINPSAVGGVQGYDSAMLGDGSSGRFDPTGNAALDVSDQQPLRLQPGSSLVSTVSHPTAGQLPQLETCAVLTCLAEQPPPNSFRPPYCGQDKRCRWSANDLDLTALARLEFVPGSPTMRDLIERFERTWLDHLPGFSGRYLHPRHNMPDYGRDLADLVGVGALCLQLDLPAEDKRPLAIAMCQIGIDNFGVVRDGGRFRADGGSGSGRKFPILLAGALLHDEELLRTARERQQAFAEDVQTFYVEQTSPGIYNHGHGGYVAADVGLPEWGNRHADDPSQDRKAWTADPYRRCCTANAWHGFVLATRIMGLREQWGHDALFDYVDRYMQVETAGSWTRSWSPFAERMWDRYRGDF